MNRGGINVPSIPMLVSVAKMLPAGVKPAYAHDWKAAASEPRKKSKGRNVS
jgi:hypothetical protein